MKSIPVKGVNGLWLSPCAPARARQLIKARKAVMRDDAGQPFLQLTVAEAELPQATVEASA